MIARRIRAAAFAVALLATTAAVPAMADFSGGLRLADAGSERNLISRDRAAEVARSATGGRVLRVDLQDNGRPMYRVRVLVDGERVTTVAVDAQSGRLRE